MHALPQGLLCRVIWRSQWAADCILQVMPLPTSLLCKQQPCNARGTALLAALLAMQPPTLASRLLANGTASWFANTATFPHKRPVLIILFSLLSCEAPSVCHSQRQPTGAGLGSPGQLTNRQLHGPARNVRPVDLQATTS